MRTTPLAATLLLLASPAFAQQRDQSQSPDVYNLQPPPPLAGPAGDLPPAAVDRGSSGAVEALIQRAREALSRDAWPLAEEYVQRAETLLREAHAGEGKFTRQAGMREGRALDALADARKAIGERDGATSAQALQSAQVMLGEVAAIGTTAGTGASAGDAAPAEGGGQAAGQGGAATGTR